MVNLTQEVHRNDWFRVLKQEVRTTTHRALDYYTIDFPTPAVGIVARNDDNYLLIRQYRFIVDQFVWAIPSGGVSLQESTIQAAKRELFEETGYTAERISPLMNFFASYGCSNQEFQIFLAENVVQASQQYDTEEVLEVSWISASRLRHMLANNEIVDGLSLAPLMLALLQSQHE